MKRRFGVALVVLAVLSASCGGASGRTPDPSWQPPNVLPRSADPIGRDRLAFDSDRDGHFELFTMTTTGADPQRITSDPAYDSWGPRISPDRRTILFTRAPAGVHDRDPVKASLWAIGADGSGLTQLRPPGLDGWGLLGHAEWAPDGSGLVMVGGARSNAQIYLTDPLGRKPRKLTDRPGTNIDPSFHPDGKAVVFVGCPAAICTPSSYEIYRVPTSGGEPTRLTDDRLPDYDPMYAPNGTTLAWLTNLRGGTTGTWDVRLQDGSGPIRRLVGDDGITSRPQFSADGRTIYLHRIPPDGNRFGVYRVGVDGSDLTDLTAGQPGNNEYPST